MLWGGTFRGGFPALKKPLPAVAEGAAALAERLTFAALQHAVLIHPQLQRVAAGRKAVAVQGMHARRKILAAQQLAAAVDIDPGIAINLDHHRGGVTADALINVGVSGAEPQAVKAGQRQQGKAEVTAQRAGKVALVHAACLQVVAVAHVLTRIEIVEPQTAGAGVAHPVPGVGPVAAQKAAFAQPQRTGAVQRQILAVLVAAVVGGLTVNKGVFCRRRRGQPALILFQAGQPGGFHKQQHRALAFIQNGRHAVGGDIAAARRRAAVAGQVAMACQRLAQGLQCLFLLLFR
ncbi:hypothetical protein D3C80_611040 [compost metagenome]